MFDFFCRCLRLNEHIVNPFLGVGLAKTGLGRDQLRETSLLELLNQAPKFVRILAQAFSLVLDSAAADIPVLVHTIDNADGGIPVGRTFDAFDIGVCGLEGIKLSERQDVAVTLLCRTQVGAEEWIRNALISQLIARCARTAAGPGRRGRSALRLYDGCRRRQNPQIESRRRSLGARHRQKNGHDGCRESPDRCRHSLPPHLPREANSDDITRGM